MIPAIVSGREPNIAGVKWPSRIATSVLRRPCSNGSHVPTVGRQAQCRNHLRGTNPLACVGRDVPHTATVTEPCGNAELHNGGELDRIPSDVDADATTENRTRRAPCWAVPAGLVQTQGCC